MDTIHIEGLRVDTIIGVFDWEKQAPQPLVFDLVLPTDCRLAGKNDELDKALNYQSIIEFVEEFVADNSGRWELLESLLEALAQSLLEKFVLPHVDIRVYKPKVMPQARSVSIQIKREASDYV